MSFEGKDYVRAKQVPYWSMVMALLKFDEILEAKDSRYKDIEVKEWGGTVRIGTMSIADREAIEVIAADPALNKRDLRARFLIASILGEDGKPIFSLKDLPKLRQKSARVVDKLFAVAQAFNNITDEDVDVLAKNF